LGNIFKSVAELEAAIDAWIAGWNAKPKPLKWTARADVILEKTARASAVLAQSNEGSK
jgi:hypothetical protein